MKLKELLKTKNMSIYSLSKLSDVPYSTLRDLCNEKTDPNKMTIQNAYNIANALNISMEELINKEETQVNCRSRICHELSKMNEKDYILKILKENRILKLYRKSKIFECYYTLALLDYLCNKNGIEINDTYKELRKFKFDKVMYPSSTKALIKTKLKTEKQIIKESIPEFIKYNIAEVNVNDSI